MMEQTRGQSANQASCEIHLFVSTVHVQNTVSGNSLWKASFCNAVSSETNGWGTNRGALQNTDCRGCLKPSYMLFCFRVSWWQRLKTLHGKKSQPSRGLVCSKWDMEQHCEDRMSCSRSLPLRALRTFTLSRLCASFMRQRETVEHGSLKFRRWMNVIALVHLCSPQPFQAAADTVLFVLLVSTSNN